MNRLVSRLLLCGLLASPPSTPRCPPARRRRTSARRPRWRAGHAFKLNEALKQGPVVLYFFPAAFTQGCTIEAHNFAEATDEYRRWARR